MCVPQAVPPPSPPSWLVPLAGLCSILAAVCNHAVCWLKFTLRLGLWLGSLAEQGLLLYPAVGWCWGL